MTGRIAAAFAKTKAANRAALIAFVMAGDPDHETAAKILRELPGAGADIIELGMPFSDPMADGPAIQAAGLRALNNGATMHRTLDLARGFRRENQKTPLILMGYFNPILAYGPEKFIEDAAQAGIDGFIIVDLPPEEDEEFRSGAQAAGLDVIHLATPTTDAARLPKVLNGASGFLYYVSITGITGTKSAAGKDVAEAIAEFRRHTKLPIAAGFGLRAPEQIKAIAGDVDGVVVGSALAGCIAANLDGTGQAGAQMMPNLLGLVRQLADAAHRN
ncbi:MAG: tryptophan synthase subunit alpha [Alphaproteobacteria bacterium]